MREKRYIVKEMNKDIFRNHLRKAVEELKAYKQIEGENYRFQITPVVEKGKPMMAMDEFLRLNVLNPKRVHNKVYTEDDIVTMLSINSPFVPIWINLSYIKSEKEYILMNLECSLRLRKPSLLRNQESGHAPFKVIV